jgi:hypothetical protein
MSVGYFAQNQAEFDGEITLLQTMEDATDTNRSKVRDMLGHSLRGDDVRKGKSLSEEKETV